VDCPKCRADLSATAAECPSCGIIIAKYLEREQPIPDHVQGDARGWASTPDANSERGDLAARLRGVESTTSMAAAIGRGALLLLLALLTTALVGSISAERVNGSFLHLPNLVFHEAGHILFSPFGRFMTVLGGSLTQLLIPLACAGTSLWQTRDPFGAAVALWWAGENLIDIAPYIDDARDLKLVLLGGKTGAEVEGHDWEYLLNAMGVAHKDHTIAGVVHAMGTLTLIAGLVWGAIVVLNQTNTLRRRRRTSL
jgi:hypothetical protein